jgi:hypothetical protein
MPLSRSGPFDSQPHPVAVTLERAAELLGADPARVAAAAVHLSPYIHRDGSLRWSLRELARELGGTTLAGSRARTRARARKRKAH